MAGEHQPRYAFGNFVVDVSDRRLECDGHPVPLTPKAFDTLVLLVENAGRLVEKDVFMSRVWPDTVVEDASLAQNISQLRKALHEGLDATKYIETVPKRGYRFIAPVHSLTAPPENSQAEPPKSQALEGTRIPPAHSFRLWAFAIAALLFLAGSLALITRPHRASASSEIRSIVVLPFENLSGNPTQEYLCDGIADELVTSLARLHDVRVISHTSAMAYKHTHKPLSQIAKELNVDAVVEGTIASSDRRVRVRAQLVRASNDEDIWADAYERDLSDVLALQSDLAHDISAAIHTRIPKTEPAAATTNAQAHEAYLKGRYFWNKRDRDGLQKAVTYFEQAIDKDPKYAAAYSGLADCYIILGGYGILPQPLALQKAKAAAEKAVALDDHLAEAHASLGLLHTFIDWNWNEAKRELERAIELNPNYATAHHWYGDGYLAPVGRIDDAIAELRKAQELDPLSPIIVTDIGKALYYARRYDDAITELNKALELDPNFSQAHGWLSSVYLEKGMLKESQSEAALAHRDAQPQDLLLQSAYVAAREGRKEEARRLLSQLLPTLQKDWMDPGAIALVYGAMGERNEAFAWLGKSCDSHSSFMTSLKMWPAYDPLRNDPRFDDLIRRVGLQ